MKLYTPPRLLECVHHDHDCNHSTKTGYDETKPECADPTPCPGFCPKLVIKSQAPAGYPLLGPMAADGTPIEHAIVFSGQEVRTLVREADKGYFDLPGMPERKESRFWDPLTSMLMQALQDEPLRALGMLLFLGNPQTVAYVAEPPMLAMQDSEGAWLCLHLDATTIDEWQAPEPEPDPEADAQVIEFPDPVSHHDTMPEGATILWRKPAREENPSNDITD